MFFFLFLFSNGNRIEIETKKNKNNITTMCNYILLDNVKKNTDHIMGPNQWTFLSIFRYTNNKIIVLNLYYFFVGMFYPFIVWMGYG